jgi:hypothetical protein
MICTGQAAPTIAHDGHAWNARQRIIASRASFRCITLERTCCSDVNVHLFQIETAAARPIRGSRNQRVHSRRLSLRRRRGRTQFYPDPCGLGKPLIEISTREAGNWISDVSRHQPKDKPCLTRETVVCVPRRRRITQHHLPDSRHNPIKTRPPPRAPIPNPMARIGFRGSLITVPRMRISVQAWRSTTDLLGDARLSTGRHTGQRGWLPPAL